MIGKLNHVAIAVPDAEAAGKIYKDTLGAKVTGKVAQPDHGVWTVFVELPNTKIELIEPLGDNSPIAAFLAKNPKGGMHHVCYEVEDIVAACAQMKKNGRHHHRHRRATHRRARQARRLHAPQGFQRHPDRT